MRACRARPPHDLKGGDPAHNAAAIRAVLRGEAGPVARRRGSRRRRRAAGRRPSARPCARVRASPPGPSTAVRRRRRWSGWSHITNTPSRRMSDVLAGSAPSSASISRAARRSCRWRALLAGLPAEPPRGFARALAARTTPEVGTPLIAEIKKASPSKGLIRADFDPPALAPRLHGRWCRLPVRADRRAVLPGAGRAIWRRRAPRCLCRRCARTSCSIPGRSSNRAALGADCVLLIMACLDDAAARELAAAAAEHGMDVLVEVHDEAELDRALALPGTLLGRQQPQPEDARGRPRHLRAAGAAGAGGSAAGGRERALQRTPICVRMAAAGRAGVPGRREPDARGRRDGRDAPAAGLASPHERAHPFRCRRQRRDGRRHRQGRHRAHRYRRGPGDDGAGNAGADRRARLQEGRRAGRGAARRHHGRQAHGRPDPALPSAAAELR